MSRQWILRAVVGLTGGAIAAGVCFFGDWLPIGLGYCLNITPSEPVGITGWSPEEPSSELSYSCNNLTIQWLPSFALTCRPICR